MKLEELFEIERQSCVILCWKCLEQKEYNIPLFKLNEFNEIEYKCIKRHKIGKEDINYQLLNEKIKKQLTFCKNEKHFDVHQGQPSVFCAFCEICEKNICHFGLGDDMHKHDYILYTKEIETKLKNINEKGTKQKLDRLEKIINVYKEIYPGERDEIKYLIKTYNRKFMNYRLYFIENIRNYQTIQNLLFNYHDDFTEKDLIQYENNINKDRYKFLYKAILNKESIKNINKIELNIKKEEKDKLAILIKDNDINEENKMYFCILSEESLKIYDIKGENKKEIKLECKYDFLFTLYNNNKIILKANINLVLLDLSDDFKTCQIKYLYFNYRPSFRDFYLIDIYNNTQFLKTSSNKFIFINRGKAFIAENSPNIIEENFLMNIDSSSEITEENYLRNFLKVFNAKRNYDEFDSILLPRVSSNILKFGNKYILKGNSAYYEDNNNNNNILEGIIILSIDYNRKSKITMFDENLKKRFEIGFEYTFNHNDRVNLLEIIYNYLNDMILIFIDSKIYQIDNKTKQIVTIYNNDKIFSSCEINSFYSYNEKNNKLEQIIIAHKKDSGDIFVFHWKQKFLFLKKKYVLPKIKEIIPIFTPTILRDLVNNNNYNERTIDENILLIESDKLLLYN